MRVNSIANYGNFTANKNKTITKKLSSGEYVKITINQDGKDLVSYQVTPSKNNPAVGKLWRALLSIPVVLIVLANPLFSGEPNENEGTGESEGEGFKISMAQRIDEAKRQEEFNSLLETYNALLSAQENKEPPRAYVVKANIKYDNDEWYSGFDALKEAGGEAYEYFYRLSYALNGEDEYRGMNELIDLCENPDYGDCEVNPIILCAQMFAESEYGYNTIGENGNKIGLGQLRESDVDKINYIYDTNYNYDDRYNFRKNLEMMILLMRHCVENTGYYDEALAMYHTGNPNGLNTPEGKRYAKLVMSQLGNYVSA